MLVTVSDNVFHSLHDRFDRGETRVSSGKSDGTDRPLTRGPDGFMRGPAGEVIVRRDFLDQQMEEHKIAIPTISRDQQKLAKKLKGRGWQSNGWEYSKTTGKPVAVVYKNSLTGKVKRIPVGSTEEPKACDHCGMRATVLKVCAGCRAVRYCTQEHQKLAWKEHKHTCRG